MQSNPEGGASLPLAGRRPTGTGWLVVFVIGAGLYLLTMAPGLVWQDGAETQLRALLGEFGNRISLSRAHVLHMILIWCVQKLSGSEPTTAANLVSVIGGAATIATVYGLCTMLVRRRVAAICAAGALGLSHTLWQFSTMAEVYTVTTALLSGEVFMLLLFARDQRLRWLVWAGLLNGLGWSTHNVAMLAWPVYLCAAWWGRDRWPGGRVKVLGAVLGVWSVGVLPLLVICARAYMENPDLLELMGSLLAGPYGRHVFNVVITPVGLMKVAGYFVLNFPSPVILFAALGWWVGRRRWKRAVWMILSGMMLVHFVFVVRYSVPDQYAFFLPTYVLMALFVAAGVEWMLDRVGSVPVRAVCVITSFWSPIFYLAAPGIASVLPAGALPLPARSIKYRDPVRWFLQPWHHTCSGPARYAREALGSVPPNAVLLLDSTVRPVVLYVQISESRRLDVQINKGRFQSWLTPEVVTGDNIETFMADGRLYASATRSGYLGQWIVERVRFEYADPLYRLYPRADGRSPSGGSGVRPEAIRR